LERIYIFVVEHIDESSITLRLAAKKKENSTHCKSTQYNPPAEMLHYYHLPPLHQYSSVQPAHPIYHKHIQ
jgi:hypothetical protein